jgi:hypothetical protein
VDLQAACRAASKATAHIDDRVKTKLLKLSRKHGLTESEVTELAEALKRAAGHTKRLHLGSSHHKQQH